MSESGGEGSGVTDAESLTRPMGAVGARGDHLHLVVIKRTTSESIDAFYILG